MKRRDSAYIGTIAVAKVTPVGKPDKAFIAVSMYARWLKSHPYAPGDWSVSVNSAHRIISDLATFIGNTNPASHRILAAGDLNMFLRCRRRRPFSAGMGAYSVVSSGTQCSGRTARGEAPQGYCPAGSCS